VDRIGARAVGRVEHAIDAQIAVAWRARADRVRFVGIAHVQCRPVALRIHRGRRNPHLAAGARNADSDLAAIRNQDFVHEPVIVVRLKPGHYMLYQHWRP
jgi:hypothetical protein